MFISNKDMEILCEYSKANMKDRKSDGSLLCDKPRCANYADIISHEIHDIGQDIISLKSDLDDVVVMFGIEEKYYSHIDDAIISKRNEMARLQDEMSAYEDTDKLVKEIITALNLEFVTNLYRDAFSDERRGPDASLYYGDINTSVFTLPERNKRYPKIVISRKDYVFDGSHTLSLKFRYGVPTGGSVELLYICGLKVCTQVVNYGNSFQPDYRKQSIQNVETGDDPFYRCNGNKDATPFEKAQFYYLQDQLVKMLNEYLSKTDFSINYSFEK